MTNPNNKLPATNVKSKRLSKGIITLLIILPLAVFFVSLFFGRYSISPVTCVQVLLSKFIPIQHTWSDNIETIIWQIRFPRALTAMLIGSGLAISGAAFQGMFRNPLVSPDILGVSAATGFGACLAMLISASSATTQLFAVGFGIAGVVITYFLSRVYKTTPILMLVLSGVVIGSVFSSGISIIKFAADPYSKLPAITFWLMGGLGTASWGSVFKVGIPVIIGATILILLSWRINILSLGDEEARTLGINTEPLKAIIIVCCTVITASTVCVAGIVGWVGLVIPHIGRMIGGPNHRVTIPVCMTLGAAYLLFIDDIARTLTTSEIPLGILTAIVGAPFFGYLLRKTKGAWK
jgi:iron complex transport system permease protein